MKAKYHDLEDMVYRMQLSFDEIMDILDKKIFHQKERVILYQLVCMKLVILTQWVKSFLPNIVKVNITIDNIRLKSNLRNNQILIFT